MKIQELVAEQLLKNKTRVPDAVVQRLVDVEINRRVDTLSKALNKQESLAGEIKKIDQPDQSTFDTAGVETKSFSAKRFNELKKLKGDLAEIEKLTDEAMEQNTTEAYNKLEKKVEGTSFEITTHFRYCMNCDKHQFSTNRPWSIIT